MKTLSPALQAHLAGDLSTLAYLVKITRNDGVVFGFTSSDRPLTIDGVTYRADTGFTPSSLASSAGLNTDNLEITGILDSSAIADADIAAGLFDQARIDFYVCNWADTSQGLLQLRRGWLGEVTRASAHYVAELRGLHDLLQRPVGDYYTPECRFDLGDSRCGVNLASVTASGTATSAIDNETFSDTSQNAASGLFNYGKLTWVTGANSGLSVEVKNWDLPSQTFTLWLPLPNPISTGDAYTVAQGCDKRFSTCQGKFSNVPNFGGFPYVPGVGNILQYPS